MSPETKYIVETITKRIDRFENTFDKKIKELESEIDTIDTDLNKMKLTVAERFHKSDLKMMALISLLTSVGTLSAVQVADLIKGFF